MTLPSPPDLVLRTCPRCETESCMEEAPGNWVCGRCNFFYVDDDGADDRYQREKDEPEEGE